MTTGRINQVTIVSFPRLHTGSAGRHYRRRAGRRLRDGACNHKAGLASLRSPPRAARLHLGRAGCPPDTGAQPSPAEGQAHKASPGPTIPEAPRASPTCGETPGPQGEDCRQTKGTSGPQVWADLQVAHSAVRFYPSAINPLFPHTHGAHATQGRHPSKPGPPAEAHPNKGQKSPEGARDISSLPKPDEQPAARQERQWFGKEKASKPTEALGAGLSATLRQR